MAGDVKSGVTIYGKDLTLGGQDDSKQKLEDLLIQTTNVIYEASNIFPFDIFPDKVIIRPTKIDLVYGMFLMSDHVVSMLIKDIKAVKLTTGIFFGSLHFELQGYEDNPPTVKFLWREEAMKTRRIVSGLMAVYQNGIDLTILNPQELCEKAEEIGRAREV